MNALLFPHYLLEPNELFISKTNIQRYVEDDQIFAFGSEHAWQRKICSSFHILAKTKVGDHCFR